MPSFNDATFTQTWGTGSGVLAVFDFVLTIGAGQIVFSDVFDMELANNLNVPQMQPWADSDTNIGSV